MINYLTKCGNIITVLEGWKVWLFGQLLLKKPDKTEDELIAAKSFRRFRNGTIAIVIIAILILFVATPSAFGVFTKYSGNKRYGTVENGMVKYVQNDIQYRTFAELGLLEYDLQENDRILLLFDTAKDTLLQAIPQSIYDADINHALFGLLVSMLVSIFILVFWMVAAERMVAKEFVTFYALTLRQWKNKKENISDSRWELYEQIFRRIRQSEEGFGGTLMFSLLVLASFITIGVCGAAMEVTILAIPSLVVVCVILAILSRLEKTRLYPIYYRKDELLNTQLLVKDENGSIGYLSKWKAWIHITGVSVIREGKDILKVKYIGYNTAKNLKFSEIGYLAKEDPLYEDIMRMKIESKVIKGSAWLPCIFLFLVLLGVLAMNLFWIAMRF